MLICVFLLLGLCASGTPAAASPLIARCELEGVVDAGSGAYLTDCVKRAEEKGAQALLVRLDTPGGSLEATRAIVRAFLGSRVPVLVWVGPVRRACRQRGRLHRARFERERHGARDKHRRRAPGGGSGRGRGSGGRRTARARKIENDTVAFAEGIARQRGRNPEWAAAAVRDSASVPADRAVALRVVELIAPTEAAFLTAVDGRRVEVADGDTVTLATREARIESLTPGLSQRVVHTIAQPSIVDLLFLVAALGLAAEASIRAVAPGLVGVVALVLALMASATLPVRSGALVLMLVGVGLIIAELFVTSGLLGAAGAGPAGPGRRVPGGPLRARLVRGAVLPAVMRR